MDMFDNGFSQYLSYGATDQKTLSYLTGSYDGLIVPGTVAAFQLEGTGGFVLSLSAAEAVPYVIDPRSPLFQQALQPPTKKSHEALATLLGHPGLVRSSPPTASSINHDLTQSIATAWVEFNERYGDVSGGKFEKYAKRLGREIRPVDSQKPAAIIPPYFVSTAPDDPWWILSRRLFDASQHAAKELRCIRVAATNSPSALKGMLDTVPDQQIVVWVSAFDELERSAEDLVAYGLAIRNSGKAVFALYGGFFSVLLGNVGLRGASHGIGFGESRDWVELPRSGPPPARYYLPLIHRYVTQEFAHALWEIDPEVVGCPCEHCVGRSPLILEYHELMHHSVHCRKAEIDAWSDRGLGNCVTLLRDEQRSFARLVGSADLVPPLQRYGERAARHLPRWLDALVELDT